MARVAPVTSPQRGVSTHDLPIQQMQVLDLTEPMAQLPIETIDSVENSALPKDHAERLAFMEEPIVIQLEPTSERNPPKAVFVGVNGDKRWVPVGVPVRMRRKHVEVLARAQPFSVQTDVGTAFEARPHNRIIRTSNRRYPFSVLEDPSPRGRAWLNKVSFEG